MTVRTNVTGATEYVLQEALTGYAFEAYTNARKLSGTGLVGSNPDIDVSTETFQGQMRWHKPLTAVVNVASLTNSADGTKTTNSTDYLTYIKTVRTHGMGKINIQKVVTQQDTIERIARDLGETQSQDEHNAILSILKGVAISEAINGCAAGSGATGLGGQTFDNDPTDKKYGFYVDLGAAKSIIDPTTTYMGAARAEGFLRAFGMAYKDYEPPFAYLICSPETKASLRSANLVDQTKVTEGNVEFETIFGGKFRLLQTRASQALTSGEMTKLNTGAGVDIVGTKVTFIVLPGAIAFEPLPIDEPVGIDKKAASYNGGGSTEAWYRWGYVAHPAGYNWVGSADAFPADADYQKVSTSGTLSTLSAATSGLANVTGTWVRKSSSALSLGILPVFHS